MTRKADWTAEVDHLRPAEPLIQGGRTPSARWRARLCLGCGERRALFAYQGVVKADRQHTLCFACYRAEVDCLRARPLGASPAGVAPVGPRLRPSKAFADRAALLAGLALRRRRAQIMARHALDTPEPVRADAALAS